MASESETQSWFAVPFHQRPLPNQLPPPLVWPVVAPLESQVSGAAGARAADAENTMVKRREVTELGSGLIFRRLNFQEYNPLVLRAFQ
jgi:hypothetical protein